MSTGVITSTQPRLKQRISDKRETSIQKYRHLIQAVFAALCVWIGVEFFLFVRYLESGGTAHFIARPPGVEGFLPISSLMSLYYFFLSGQIHPVHPAGLFILVAILLISLVFGKAFCSWLCPVGFLSEFLGNLGEKIFRQKLTLSRWLDYPLRSLKYLLLGFFAWAIFLAMNEAASIVVRNFWCRYLCPYGALLGIFSLISPHKIKRNLSSCTDCSKCAMACPSHIKVDKIQTVISDECSTCLACVDACTDSRAVALRPVLSRRRTSKKLVAATVVIAFMVITGAGMITGYWQNSITREKYLYHQQHLGSYGHPTGAAEIAELKRDAEMMNSGNGEDNVYLPATEGKSSQTNNGESHHE